MNALPDSTPPAVGRGTYTATYSPDDNKLRLYSTDRLSPELYDRVRAAGFKWAPKQGLFVAPMWTPAREDLLLELCGEIDDEDKSLVERSEERAERFTDYRHKRLSDAENARAAVSAITDNIPFGQPILVGHHSERRARKDAERIENGMCKAVKMWETSKYWLNRAEGALRHAKYKELPRVRANRIKTIEADKRRQERSHVKAQKLLDLYTDAKYAEYAEAKAHDGRPMRAAVLAAGFDCGLSFEASRAFEKGELSYDEALARAVRNLTATVAYCDRWIAHYSNRAAYERAMLDEQGASDLLAPKPRPKQLPLCNYRAPEGISILNRYNQGRIDVYPQVEMTQAEYARVHNEYKGTRVVDRTHRVRAAMRNHSLVCVFITDSKVHDRPTAQTPSEPEPNQHTPPAVPRRCE